MRWIDADDLHLTLRFAGDIDNRTADELADRLAAIDISTFEMRLSGLGAFGGRDPRNLWVGVAGLAAVTCLLALWPRLRRWPT